MTRGDLLKNPIWRLVWETQAVKFKIVPAKEVFETPPPLGENVAALSSALPNLDEFRVGPDLTYHFLERTPSESLRVTRSPGGGGPRIDDDDPDMFITSQRSGNCAVKSPLVALRLMTRTISFDGKRSSERLWKEFLRPAIKYEGLRILIKIFVTKVRSISINGAGPKKFHGCGCGVGPTFKSHEKNQQICIVFIKKLDVLYAVLVLVAVCMWLLAGAS